MSFLTGLVALACIQQVVYSLDNGMARKPVMGWLSWEMFRCQTNCQTHPTACINADLYQTMADAMVSGGFLDAGYDHVNIDDCWNTHARDPTTNEQVADPQRFPQGIKGVADYVHAKGLKLGLYNDIGTKSCAGYTGIDGYYTLDANTFASWGIDMIKVDGCYASTSTMHTTYPKFGAALNATGRAITYSCSWPAYVSGHGETNPPVDQTTMAELAKYCNLWRNYGDIQDSWGSVQSIVSYWRRDYNTYASTPFLNVAGPGNWNDPDMVIVGDPGLNAAQQRSQLALWSIFAAPLLMGNDVRSISATSKAILTNKEVVAINQDPLGKQGGYIWENSKSGAQVIWLRELADKSSLAIVLQNTSPTAELISFQTFLVPSFVNNGAWTSNSKFSVRDLWAQKQVGNFTSSFQASIGSDDVGMYKVTLMM